METITTPLHLKPFFKQHFSGEEDAPYTLPRTLFHRLVPENGDRSLTLPPTPYQKPGYVPGTVLIKENIYAKDFEKSIEH